MGEIVTGRTDYGFLYRIIPAPHSVVKFWLDQPLFVSFLTKMESEGIEINSDSICKAMTTVYEMMVENPDLAEKSNFIPSLARRAMKKLAQTNT